VDLGEVHGTRIDVGDTVVVCRPDQVREAAIVVSCLPADRLTPVVTVEPPPMSEAEYITLFELRREAQDSLQGHIGTPLGSAEAYSGGQESKQRLAAEHAMNWELAQAVAPYRSWLKRNERIKSLLKGLGIQRAVLLDDFASEELNALDPALSAEYNRAHAALAGEEYVPDRTQGMLDEVPFQLHVPCADLVGLTSSAWRLLRDPNVAPERMIEVPADDRAGYVAALFTALHTGAVLHAVDAPSAESGPAFSTVNLDAEEAVLVENTGHPDSLLGAIYAHHRRARLVITPEPDLEAVQSAVAEQQHRVTAAARSIGEGTRGTAFADVLWRMLSEGGRNPFAVLEAAVTAQVPATAIAEVGERRLTAFTIGLPYSFVRTETADWSRKPIGHMAADATLIILNELYGAAAAPQSEASFTLVFDPGFFRGAETDDVMRTVGAHVTHPILLSGPAATWDALFLPDHLPVELIFFNTHGSDDAIVLGDVPLHNWRIPQYVTLRHRPLVFNNSCQSWTGVGREFVRSGARGYIGTLWAVPSDLAADFARVVVDRLTAQEMTACEAIVDTGLRAGIERSYLYVGTAAGRLDQSLGRALTSGETALAACAMLADAASGSVSEVARVLLREITLLRRAAEGTPHQHTAAYVDALLCELGMLISPDRVGDRALESEVTEWIDASLHLLDLPSEEVDSRWATRFSLTAHLHLARDEWAAALADLGRSVSYGAACEDRANLLLTMASIHMRLGDWEQAQHVARSSHDLCEEQQDTSGEMRAIGVLGQLCKRDERHGEAMAYAEEGYALAVTLHDRKEQGIFKLDQCSLHRIQGDIDAAIAAATRALELFRVDHDERSELAALGQLGRCHLHKGDLAAAEQYVVQGLAQARSLGVSSEVVSFASDLGELLVLREQHADALGYYCEAAAVAVETGYWDLGTRVLAELVECASRLGDAKTLWSAAVWGSRICRGAPDERLRSEVLPVCVEALKNALRTGSAVSTAQGITDVFPVAVLDSHAESSPYGQFLSNVVLLLDKWVTDAETDQLGAFARELDAQSGGVLGLAEFVANPYTGHASGGQRRGRWWRRG
jgi:tetratricopeptide (TPR) repeat protein